MNEHSDQVTGLIKELLSLNHADSAPATHPRSGEEIEQRRSKPKRVRQELVLALSLRG